MKSGDFFAFGVLIGAVIVAAVVLICQEVDDPLYTRDVNGKLLYKNDEGYYECQLYTP